MIDGYFGKLVMLFQTDFTLDLIPYILPYTR